MSNDRTEFRGDAMASTRPHRQPDHGQHQHGPSRRGPSAKRPAALRRGLRREAPTVIGVLADPADFTTMTAYPSFAFEDHPSYLRAVHGLLRSLAAQHLHISAVLFDPEEFRLFCAEEGLDADSAAARTCFTAELAASGAGLRYTGQPMDELVPELIDQAARHATWEHATLLLATTSPCTGCGADLARAAVRRARTLLTQVVEGAGPGHHHLVCSVPVLSGHLLTALHAEHLAPPGPGAPTIRLHEGGRPDFLTVLAAGLAAQSPGGLVLRSSADSHPDLLRGWRLQRGAPVPLSAAEVFDAYCTDVESGEPMAPEPGVEYHPGFAVDVPGPHHGHCPRA
ncbi:hypothetical protein [Streptomyces sp. NPDC006879]|uniref:hypothetical protein n=1 Tax=Streptomyces sp. NPDC006879 TaxID=3364767 RepID=UPI003682D5AB